MGKIPVRCPLCRKVSFTKLSSFFNFARLSRVHFPWDSLSTESTSSLKSGTYSGYFPRLKIEFVINWLVVLTETAPIPNCKIPWKWGSFFSCSGTRSLSHSIASFGFFQSVLLSRTFLSSMIGATSSRALALHFHTVRSSGMKCCTTGRSQGWKYLSFAEEIKMFFVYCCKQVRKTSKNRFPGTLPTLQLMSIHSSFLWRRLPTKIFPLTRLMSRSTFGYTRIGSQSAHLSGPPYWLWTRSDHTFALRELLRKHDADFVPYVRE